MANKSDQIFFFLLLKRRRSYAKLRSPNQKKRNKTLYFKVLN